MQKMQGVKQKTKSITSVGSLSCLCCKMPTNNLGNDWSGAGWVTCYSRIIASGKNGAYIGEKARVHWSMG